MNKQEFVIQERRVNETKEIVCNLSKLKQTKKCLSNEKVSFIEGESLGVRFTTSEVLDELQEVAIKLIDKEIKILEKKLEEI